MSQYAAIVFMEKVRDDAALQAELRNLAPTEFQKLVDIAVQHGFEAFTKADYYHGATVVCGEWILWTQIMQGLPPDLG